MTCSKLHRRLQLVLICFLLLGMGGCASLGFGTAKPLTVEGSRQALTIGASTKADVTRVLGGDAKVNTFLSGYEVWVYNYKAGLPLFLDFLPVVGTLATAVDIATDDRELAILFDKDGIVRKYRMREADSRLKQALSSR